MSYSSFIIWLQEKLQLLSSSKIYFKKNTVYVRLGGFRNKIVSAFSTFSLGLQQGFARDCLEKGDFTALPNHLLNWILRLLPIVYKCNNVRRPNICYFDQWRYKLYDFNVAKWYSIASVSSELCKIFQWSFFEKYLRVMVFTKLKCLILPYTFLYHPVTINGLIKKKQSIDRNIRGILMVLSVNKHV